MTTRIGINGLGRIGRCAIRQTLHRDDVEVVGVNDLIAVEQIAYLLRYDSVHGPFPGEVAARDTKLDITGSSVPVFGESNPSDIPWSDIGADIIIESTGAFRSRDDAAAHLEAGAKRVIISAPSDDADVTIVPGVNDFAYQPEEHRVMSMASCTTNCVAPVLKVLHDSFEVERAMFMTVHAYTSSQSIVDGPSRKLRRGRAAAESLVPTTTGAADATSLVLPELEGRLDGVAVRAPVPDGSLIDLTCTVKSAVDREPIHEEFRKAASGSLEGILDITEDELVSADIIGNPHSAVVDAATTSVLADQHVRVLAWYDNEMGYAARLVDLSAAIGAR